MTGGTYVDVVSETLIEGGSGRILYEPIPFDLMFDASELPGVNLWIEGILAACYADECTYTTV